MSGEVLYVPEGEDLTSRPHRRGVALLVYALGGGIVWWTIHLVVGAALVPGVCDGMPRWLLTVNNLVCAAGVLTALAASLALRRPSSAADALTGRSRLVAHVALVANLAALALVVLESVPTYVLGSCS